ncbi:hypothetical protein RJ55_05198 [Drechmeria coniospora]|nr:hypothetical protein RJ55_05198 [Drechmeria coniospora]
MRFNAPAMAVSAAVLAGTAYAQAGDAPLDHIKEAPVMPPLPKFTPTKLKAPFLEQFTKGWEKRWKPSHAKKDMAGSTTETEEWAYVGEWAVEEPVVYKGMEGDEGLVVKNPAAHHAISAKFPEKINPKGKTLVIQYEVKLQNGLECGGAYMKLLRDNEALHQEEFANTTPYVIMFGPDKCGHNNKVHFIFNHKNPLSGQYEEKHLTAPPIAKTTLKTTELYTLIVHPNNTFVMKNNGEQLVTGSLLKDFTPSVNPPEEIDDPRESKPADWVDEARIADPDAVKPADWDEEAPFEIVDEAATIPDDWLENEPLNVPDPEAQKPEDWDDEEDGDWIPPTVANPKCGEAAGCGPWTKPMKPNPDYKGAWSAPFIDNPAYKGAWEPSKIKNPAFFQDLSPADFEPMGAIGFEIWTMQNNILFDNIYIGHSVADAEKLAAETFKVKLPNEKAASEVDTLNPDDDDDDLPKAPTDLHFLDDPVLYIKEKLDLFITIAKQDPVEAVKFVPEAAGGIAAVVVTLIALLVSLLGLGSSSSPAKKAAGDAKEKEKEQEKDVKDKAKETTDKAKEATDKAASSAATGAEKAKGEVSKRTTRSQS